MVTEARRIMADQLYLSYRLRNFSPPSMLRHFEKLLCLFPHSRLARQPSTFRVIAVNYNEAPVLETPFSPPVSLEGVLAAAKDFENSDSCYRLETFWDLWQYEQEWKILPVRVALCCYGPGFEHESDDQLRIEFGIDAHFLPQPELPGSLRMIQSNIKSLLKLVHDLDDALPVDTRRLWSESGENFSEKLHQALSAAVE
ncbi:MAG TPA: hypothetical protein VEV17_19930 [Bryobacteraceae bacterium]|nr:hypothetical protein [Bryobacteraceae bacterium]